MILDFCIDISRWLLRENNNIFPLNYPLRPHVKNNYPCYCINKPPKCTNKLNTNQCKLKRDVSYRNCFANYLLPIVKKMQQ
jgi:hypothetical protein